MKRLGREAATAAGFVILALAVWRVALAEFRLDDSFITYRCARNLARGDGLVYNAGEPFLVTSAPLFAVLLAAGIRLGLDPDLLARVCGALAIGCGGFLVSVLPRGASRGARLWSGVVFVCAPPLWLALGLETPVWIAAVLLSLVLAREDRWRSAGVSMAIATLLRADAALPALLLGVVALRALDGRARLARYASTLVPLLVLAVAAAFALYATPLPATLAAKRAQASLGITGLGVAVGWWQGLLLVGASLFRQSPLYAVLLALGALGVFARERAGLAFVAVWASLHLVAYAALGVAPYRWYYVPVLPFLVLAAGRGLGIVQTRLPVRARPAVVVLAILPLVAEATSLRAIAATIAHGGPADPSLPIVDWDVYRRTGEWLSANTPRDARVGVAEVGQVGYFAERPMTDYLGLLQPDVQELLWRHDLYSWLVGSAPDYLVLQRFGGRPRVLFDHVIEHDAWFEASYARAAGFEDPRAPGSPIEILRRLEATGPFRPLPAGGDFGALRLVGLAADAAAIDAAGGALRVRLDWQVLAPAPEALHVAIKLAGVRGRFDGDYATGRWSGSVSTFHGLVVRPLVRDVPHAIRVAVGPSGGPYRTLQVATLRF